MTLSLELRAGEFADSTASLLEHWDRVDFPKRMWEHDATLWSPRPQPELGDRLGWLDLPSESRHLLPDLTRVAKEVVDRGIANVVVLGMGGSSLAPEVYQSVFSSRPAHPAVMVLDSTHPAAVQAVAERIDPERTIFVVSSKSGTTLETRSFFEFFWQASANLADRGSHFFAVTDPGSELEEVARERSFARVFGTPEEVGGRYSALTAFGLVPAATIGVDVAILLERAEAVSKATGPDVAAVANPGLQLGAAMGTLAIGGRNKVTLVTSAALDALPVWIEQLVAESTGKDGQGIVPVGGEALGDPDIYGPDRFFLAIELADQPVSEQLKALEAAGHPTAVIRLQDAMDLGAAMYLLEMAVAAAGSALGINPFNQPDVQLAKDLAQRAMAGDLEPSDPPPLLADDEGVGEAVKSWSEKIESGDYVAIQAFLPPTDAYREGLQRLRMAIRDSLGVATAMEFGPRFLHSTGQLHKGGPSTGAFLQIVDSPGPGPVVPNAGYGFDELIRAQGEGDLQALRARGRRVLSVELGRTGLDGLSRLRKTIREAIA